MRILLVEDEPDLGAAIDRVLADIQHQNRLFVIGSEDQLYRLLANLVINAVQYTPADGKVMITLQRVDHDALI